MESQPTLAQLVANLNKKYKQSSAATTGITTDDEQKERAN